MLHYGEVYSSHQRLFIGVLHLDWVGFCTRPDEGIIGSFLEASTEAIEGFACSLEGQCSQQR